MPEKNVLTVLVAENNPVAASRLTRLLAGLGWKVDYAASGKLAIRLATLNRYDVALLNIHMPDMEGENICRKLKLLKPNHPPVILMAPQSSAGIDLSHCTADDIVSDLNNYKDVVERCQRLAALTASARRLPELAVSA
ncbi:response regulator [Alteromonas pelagimontana]|uniref:Response regulator n=1 Tax=Alteromonas pelagimontana TaxID=1858656 RepID=A0A6M4MJN8_9ALTE|nr:response regulator [Alteromonas pelagimontana]QJR82296.1 response regulator [Alteromonas pelagimontana]